tara:strand:+ start:348 stop:995 length:648 start_codon:yes stop_codon:yes gene_type:complete
MARVRQFAKDLGINYNQAKDLINKGRSRRDGGSQILEKTMKPIKAKNGKSVATKPPTKSVAMPKTLRKALEEKAKKMDFDRNPENYSKFLNENKELVRRDLMRQYKEIQTMMNTKPKRERKSIYSGGEVPPRKTDPKSADRKKVKRMAGGGSNSFPDLSGDGKTTMKDILIGRGVIEKPQNKAGGGMPKMPKYRDGGAFRGCGAQVKGKKFKGIF